MRLKPKPTPERLHDVLSYDPFTGVFRWRRDGHGYQRAGGVAGHLRPDGYRRISVDGELYYAHCLAWVYHHGSWATDEVDHRNRNRDDNRIDNLRLATPVQNGQNTNRPAGVDGFPGVTRHGRRWRARIWVDGRRRHLGSFDSPEVAAAVYRDARCALHPFWDG